jgi:hypothetical protein
VEQACIDIAPTYAEYMPMAFAIANDCGEAGRSLFHRLCRISHKYNPNNADKIFTDALKGGNGANGIGSVFYLAERAGVNLGDLKRFSPIPEGGGYVSHKGAGACARIYNVQRQDSATTSMEAYGQYYPKNSVFGVQKGNFRNNFRNSPNSPNSTQEAPPKDLPYESLYEDMPAAFPTYHWPTFLQRVMDCSEGEPQRDMLFCGTVAALGATLCHLTHVKYSKRNQFPCLQVFVIAPAASGKGAISWIRRLVLPFHKEKIARYDAARANYQKEMQEWINQGKNREETTKPIPPKLELFFIAGNNSGTGIQENIIDNDGMGVILEPEAEVLSTAIQAEYGQWSHLLRKAHDHEFLSYNRRKDHEYRECDKIRLTVVICGTPGQLIQLIPGSENGLFSRELFYYMPPLDEFIDQFQDEDAESYDTLFLAWSKRWKKVVDALHKSVSDIEFIPTLSQRKKTVDCMAQLFRHATVAHGDSMRSSVVRLPINLLRIMNVVGIIRSLDSLLTMEDEEELDAKLQNITRTLLECPGITPGKGVPEENVRDGIVSKFRLTISDEDFDAILALAEPFYRHAEHALMSLPQENVDMRNASPQERFLSELPMTFTRQQSIEMGEKFALSSKQVEYYIDKLLEKGTIERISRGVYSFSATKRSDVNNESPEKSDKNSQNHT